MSHRLIKLLLIIACIGTINTSDLQNQQELLRSADLSLMQFMLRTNALSSSNPARSVQCFDYYIPLLNGITAEYQTNYGVCLTKADDSRAAIDKSTEPERSAIASAATNSCAVLQECEEENSSVPFFECFVNAGSENSKVMYSLSSNASSILSEVNEQLRLIEGQQKRCTDATERVYVEDTAKTYQEMQSCLSGLSDVPTTTTTTTATSTPTASTSASVTDTTLEPETSAP